MRLAARFLRVQVPNPPETTNRSAGLFHHVFFFVPSFTIPLSTEGTRRNYIYSIINYMLEAYIALYDIL